MPLPLSRTSTRSDAVPLGERDLDRSLRGVAELRRVGQQVEHHLDHAVEVGGDDGKTFSGRRALTSMFFSLNT